MQFMNHVSDSLTRVGLSENQMDYIAQGLEQFKFPEYKPDPQLLKCIQRFKELEEDSEGPTTTQNGKY